MKDIEKFLLDGCYSGRRNSPNLDNDDIHRIINVIVNIIRKYPETIQCLSEFYDDKYVDPAYYKPIFDYFIQEMNYRKIHQVNCPFCQKDFIVDKDYSEDIKIYTKCDSCEKEFNLFAPSQSFLRQMISYYETLEHTNCLIKK